MPVAPVHAFGADALGDHDATAIAELVATRQLQWAEVADAAIARAEAVEPHLDAIVVDTFAQARAARPLAGPFAGVPTFIKDMNDVVGIPTLHGSAALADAGAPTVDDPVVAQLIQLGLVSLGKTTMPEFGLTCSAEPERGVPTRNPWNTGHTAGGSSTGSAALVAAGVVPIAHAADGGGSIRIPAAACGLVGLKPSRGRLILSNTLKAQIVKIATDGVVSRTVRDTARFMSEIEKLYRNPKLPEIGVVDRPLDRPLRIAVLTDTVTGEPIDAPTQRAVDETLELLASLGHQVEPIPLAFDERFSSDFVTYWALAAFAAKKGGKRSFDPAFDPEALTPLTKGLAQHFVRNSWRTPAVLVRLQRSVRRYTEMLDGFDVLLTPTVTRVPPELGHFSLALPFEELFPRVEAWCGFTPLANATGTPAISLPLGHDDEANLPIGMMFGAHAGGERVLLQLALQLEAAQPFRRIDA
ncbi:MAG: amidase [Acidimicrobiales bacterium]|nr:amidase [Acidimicrobiales bacterium]